MVFKDCPETCPSIHGWSNSKLYNYIYIYVCVLFIVFQRDCVYILYIYYIYTQNILKISEAYSTQCIHDSIYIYLQMLYKSPKCNNKDRPAPWMGRVEHPWVSPSVDRYQAPRVDMQLAVRGRVGAWLTSSTQQ